MSNCTLLGLIDASALALAPKPLKWRVSSKRYTQKITKTKKLRRNLPFVEIAWVALVYRKGKEYTQPDIYLLQQAWKNIDREYRIRLTFIFTVRFAYTYTWNFVWFEIWNRKQMLHNWLFAKIKKNLKAKNKWETRFKNGVLITLT